MRYPKSDPIVTGMLVIGLGLASTLPAGWSGGAPNATSRGLLGAWVAGLQPAEAGAGSAHGDWPQDTSGPIQPLGHPTLTQRIESVGWNPTQPFRLIVYGDQRALADGEWQSLVAAIAAREPSTGSGGRPPLLAVIDTGDLVQDGRHGDQFAMFADIVQPLRAYPYLVGVGNHEVRENDPQARRHLRAALGLASDAPATTRESVDDDHFTGAIEDPPLYREERIGALRLLFLDTNDLVYGPDGQGVDLDAPRVRAQLAWLDAALEEESDGPTVVVLHHPFLASSRRHEKQARRLWSLRVGERILPHRLLESGVDLVLTGHTHTYERFALRDRTGHQLQVINVSGRPRGALLGFGAGSRRARDLRGREIEDLRERGWKDLQGLEVQQLDAMLGDEADQWVELQIEPDGRIAGRVFFLDGAREDGVRPGPAFEVDTGVPLRN